MQLTMIIASAALFVTIAGFIYQMVSFISEMDLSVPPHNSKYAHQEALNQYLLASELFRRKYYEEALKYLKNAETLIEGKAGDPKLESYIILQKTMCLFESGLATREYCLEALDLAIVKSGQAGLDAIDAKAVKASFLCKIEHYEEAAELLNDCVVIAGGAGQITEKVGQLLANLGAVYYWMGMPEESGKCLRSAQAILKRYPEGQRSWAIITMAINLNELGLEDE